MGKSLAVAVGAALIITVSGCSNAPVTSSLPTPANTTSPAGVLTEEQMQAERARVEPPAAETTRSSARTDSSELVAAEDGRQVSVQYIQEASFLSQTQQLPRLGGDTDKMVVDLGYAMCDAFDRGVSVGTLVGNLTSTGFYTASQAGTWIGATVVLCPRHQLTVLREIG